VYMLDEMLVNFAASSDRQTRPLCKAARFRLESLHQEPFVAGKAGRPNAVTSLLPSSALALLLTSEEKLGPYQGRVVAGVFGEGDRHNPRTVLRLGKRSKKPPLGASEVIAIAWLVGRAQLVVTFRG